MNLSTPEKIKEVLLDTCKIIGNYEKCALLDFPYSNNIGDCVIWLATIFYLQDICHAKVDYISRFYNFDEAKMKDKIGESPIIFPGGGNIGDIWKDPHELKERIITRYRDRPIIIFPQSVFFSQHQNLEKTAKIFNSHPNLTIFIRDNYSYEIACKNFDNCRVIKAPDIVFYLANTPAIMNNYQYFPEAPILYLSRLDKELNPKFRPENLGIANLKVGDWVSTQLAYKSENGPWLWRLPAIATLYREIWQKRLSSPQNWLGKPKYLENPWVEKLQNVDQPRQHYVPLDFMDQGFEQLSQGSIVITNRLHGHIMAVLLGIPNILLPNSYHKNEALYQEWTFQIPYARLVTDPRKVQGAVEELQAWATEKSNLNKKS
jgi:pyruvyl transferase EpsO